MRNQTKKVIAKAMKTEAEQEMEELREKPNKIFKFVKSMKRDGKDVEGGKWMKGRDGRIGLVKKINVKYGRNIWRKLRIRKMLGTRWTLLWLRGQ